MVRTSPSPTTSDATMARASRPKTLYEKLEALPEELTAEIIDGQLYTEPRPAPRHAIAASNLGAELIGPYSRAKGGPGGGWIIVEPEVHFVRKSEVLVPDLAGWRREHLPEIPDEAHLEVPPDWICEVLSPATRSKDREIKLPLYARYGVQWAWLVDARAATVEVYRLRVAAFEHLGTYGSDVTLAAPPFEAAAFRVGDLWT